MEKGERTITSAAGSSGPGRSALDGIAPRGRGRFNLRGLAVGVLIVAEAWAAGKPPAPPAAISQLFPAGGRAGSGFTCAVGGAVAGNGVWADHEGIAFRPTAKPGVFDVTVAAGVPVGVHLVRLQNEAGASPPRVFHVGRFEEASDTGSNDDFRSAQRLATVPVTVNGVLEKGGDVDTFSFRAEAGRWIVLDLQGYALGSQMDPAMKLLDGRGVELAMSHDTHNLDPRIAWEIKQAGDYFVQVMAFAHPPAADVTLKGSGSHVYRLTITDQPWASAAWPCAVPRPGAGEAKAGRLLGWNFGSKMEGPGIDGAAGGEASDDLWRVPTAHGEQVLAAVVDSPVVLEAEPNGEGDKAQRLAPPVAVSGRIDAPGDEDRCLFAAKKGDSLEFRLRAYSLHSPLDAWLRVEDRQGKVLQQADDGGEGDFDPVLRWRAPADGEYQVAVGDLFRRGGWSFVYALECHSPPPPRVGATLADHAWKVEAGKTTEIKVAVKITGAFQGPLRAGAQGLPPGVSAKEAEVPAKGGEVKLALSAAPEAATWGGPIEVVIRSSAPDAPRAWKATFDLRGVEPRGDRLVNADSRVWLSVTGKVASEKPAPSAAAPTGAP